MFMILFLWHIIWQRKLELLTEYIPIGELEDSLDIFQFLETLPNLQVLYVAALVPRYLSHFITSIRHTALLELDLHISTAPVEGPPTAGLAGLEKLCILWNASDNSDEPGSSLAHLYELIRPTLTTLVELKLDTDIPLDVFDLQLLKPTADTLRSFEYTLVQSDDVSILDTIPSILPHLTKLSITWDFSEKHSVLWKVCINLSTSHLMMLMSFCRTHISKLSRKTATLLT